ncbi:MAG: FAD-dependent oxidoreductase, partial [Lachnospiraceae bacterium]|nr:FAD-dependent oxidoreductase [Lachnospiraceae bacterium]
MKEYVIIGNGVAAAGCIEGIRSRDDTGSITVISEEKHAVYCRPLISYYLEGKTDLPRMNYRPADFYEKNRCRVLYGRKAVKIRQDKREVELDDGSLISYTELCVAAG